MTVSTVSGLALPKVTQPFSTALNDAIQYIVIDYFISSLKVKCSGIMAI